MPDWVLSLLISIGSTGVGVGIAWGVLAERVANLKEEMARKASSESVSHIDKRLDHIEKLLTKLLERDA